MKRSITFSSIIIDTCAFDAKGNDFAGFYDPMIPSLYAAIRQHDIELLSHPVLLGETENHIKNGVGSKNDIQKAITSIESCRNTIKNAAGVPKDLLEKMANWEFELQEKTLSGFSHFFSIANKLPYGDPIKVFDLYFSSLPPFSEKKGKKSEFPDAFVISSILSHLDSNSDKVILVISNDNDWKNALDDCDRIELVNSIDDALKRINGEVEKTREDILSCKTSLEEHIMQEVTESNLQFSVLDDFEIDGHKTTYCDEVEISMLQLKSIGDPVLLSRSQTEKKIQFRAELLVDGNTTLSAIDEAISDHEAVYLSYKYYRVSFKGARTCVNCSLKLTVNDGGDPIISEFGIREPDGAEVLLKDAEVSIDEY